MIGDLNKASFERNGERNYNNGDRHRGMFGAAIGRSCLVIVMPEAPQTRLTSSQNLSSMRHTIDSEWLEFVNKCRIPCIAPCVCMPG